MMSLSACDKKVSSSHFLKGHIVKHLSSHFCFIHRFICLVGYWIRPLICCQLGHKIAQWTAGARPWDCIMYDWHPKAELHNCVKFSGLRFRSLGWSSLLTPEKKKEKKKWFFNHCILGNTQWLKWLSTSSLWHRMPGLGAGGSADRHKAQRSPAYSQMATVTARGAQLSVQSLAAKPQPANSHALH